MFFRSSGTHLLLKCSWLSSQSNPTGFALCFCKLKETVFLSYGFFWVFEHKRNLNLFDSTFFFFTVTRDTAAWIILCGSMDRLSENIMKLVLPSLPCFLLQCACLFQFVKLTRTLYKILFYAYYLMGVVFTQGEMYTDLIVYFYYRNISSYSERQLGLDVIIFQCQINVAYSI